MLEGTGGSVPGVPSAVGDQPPARVRAILSVVVRQPLVQPSSSRVASHDSLWSLHVVFHHSVGEPRFHLIKLVLAGCSPVHGGDFLGTAGIQVHMRPARIPCWNLIHQAFG